MRKPLSTEANHHSDELCTIGVSFPSVTNEELQIQIINPIIFNHVILTSIDYRATVKLDSLRSDNYLV